MSRSHFKVAAHCERPGTPRPVFQCSPPRFVGTCMHERNVAESWEWYDLQHRGTRRNIVGYSAQPAVKQAPREPVCLAHSWQAGERTLMQRNLKSLILGDINLGGFRDW